MDPRARKIVSYADISPSIPDEPAPAPAAAESNRPAKRPRTSDPPQPGPSSSGVPSGFTGKALNGGSNNHQQPKKQKRDPKSWQTSRTLTHEEIWDDSALIDAWDAAMEEYRAVNGEAKGWMDEPKNKSALSWWNTQPAAEEEEEGYEEEEEGYAEVEGEEVEELVTEPLPPTDIPPHANVAAGGPPSIPFLPSSNSAALGSLPEDPDKVLELAIQSYYWAGYLMGRRDELLRRTGSAQASGAQPVSRAEDVPEYEGEESMVDEAAA